MHFSSFSPLHAAILKISLLKLLVKDNIKNILNFDSRFNGLYLFSINCFSSMISIFGSSSLCSISSLGFISFLSFFNSSFSLLSRLLFSIISFTSFFSFCSSIFGFSSFFSSSSCLMLLKYLTYFSSFFFFPRTISIFPISSLLNSKRLFPSKFISSLIPRCLSKNSLTSSLVEFLCIITSIFFSSKLVLLSLIYFCIFFFGPKFIPKDLNSASSKDVKISPEISSLIILSLTFSDNLILFSKKEDNSSGVEELVMFSTTLFDCDVESDIF